MSANTVTVREIAIANPHAIRVFEYFGIDYCCGGRKSLEEVCRERNLDASAVSAALQQAAQAGEPKLRDWTGEALEVLCRHIVDTHHAYVRRELPRLSALATKVVSRHGEKRPALEQIATTIALLADELTNHLAKEEAILFPFVTLLERAYAAGTGLPHACFSTVASPISQMMAEHDAAGGLLAQIRDLSDNFTLPADACPTYHAFFHALAEFEQDLHLHIHLENNILFPRAVQLEEAALGVKA